jgi:4-amino-4-deoxy-L-arabinose transferase-like glycosyltransferase
LDRFSTGVINWPTRATPTRSTSIASSRVIPEGGRLDRFGIPAFLATASGLLFFWNLGHGSLQDWDEATYAEIAREIRVFHDWLHLHWNYVPWFNKPPLYIWLTAGLFHFGASAFWARAISAAAAVGVVLITYAIGRRFYGRLAGLTAAIVVCSCYQFLAAARFGTSDMLLTLFLYASLYAYLEARDHPSWWYGVGIFTGLAIMTKGPAALVAPAAIIVTLVIERRLRPTLRTRHLWGGVAVALAIALPWHILSYLYYGPAFFNQYLGTMVLARVGQPIEGHNGDLFTYLGYLRNQFFPWAYVVPFALLAFTWHRLRARDGSWVIVVFPAIVLALYTLVQTKLVWYILPVYPALAILVAALLVRAFRGELVALLAVGIALLAALVSVPSSLDPVPPLLILALIGVVAILVTRSRALNTAFAPALVGAVGVFFLATVGIRSADLYTSGDLPVVSIGKSAKAAVMGRPVGLVLFIADPAQATDFDVSHSLLFYSHRPVHVAIGTAALKRAVGCKVHDVVLALDDLPSVPRDYQLSTVRQKAPLIQVAAHRVAGC